MGVYGKILTEEQQTALLEMAKNIESAESYLIILYQHMIKYQYNPEKQSPSWVNTIKTSYRQITELCKNKSILNKLHEKQNKCYIKGLSKAFKEDTGYLESVKRSIPKDVSEAGDYYELDNILNAGVDKFLNTYVYHEYAKKHLKGEK